jgi:hypothetical protein
MMDKNGDDLPHGISLWKTNSDNFVALSNGVVTPLPKDDFAFFAEREGVKHIRVRHPEGHDDYYKVEIWPVETVIHIGRTSPYAKATPTEEPKAPPPDYDTVYRMVEDQIDQEVEEFLSDDLGVDYNIQIGDSLPAAMSGKESGPMNHLNFDSKASRNSLFYSASYAGPWETVNRIRRIIVERDEHGHPTGNTRHQMLIMVDGSLVEEPDVGPPDGSFSLNRKVK